MKDYRMVSRANCDAENRTVASRKARHGQWVPGLFVGCGLALLLNTACSSDPPPPPPLTTAEKAEREDVAQLIQLYRTKDPSWPTARDAAMQDPRKAELLVQNFIMALLRAHKRESGGTAMVGSWSDFHQHQAQLIAMQPASIPFLIIGLRDKDKVVVALIKDTLTRIGEPSVKPLRARFAETPDVWERREILAVLASIGGPPMIDVLAGYVADPSWQVRGEAYWALGSIAAGLAADDEERSRTRTVLQRGLADSDRFVRCQAIKGLAELGDDESVRLLLERFRRAIALHLEVEEQRELLQSLRRVSRLPAAVNVEEFEAWLVQRKARS